MRTNFGSAAGPTQSTRAEINRNYHDVGLINNSKINAENITGEATVSVIIANS